MGKKEVREIMLLWEFILTLLSHRPADTDYLMQKAIMIGFFS